MPAKLIEPRDYQEEAAEASFKKWRTHQSTMVVSATGTGKTVIAGLAAARFPRDRRVLVLVDRKVLIEQFRETLELMCPDDVVEVEANTSRACHPGLYGNVKAQCGRIVIASVQTMSNWKRLQRWNPRSVGLIISDEADAAIPANSSYSRVFGHFCDYKLLGITATTNRLDKKSLYPFFHSLAYNYSVLAAIEDGYLVPIRQVEAVFTGWDLGTMRVNRGDFVDAEIDRKMCEEKPVQLLATAAKKWGNEGGRKKQTLVFTTSVDHAILLADVLNRTSPGGAVALYGEVDSDEVAAQLARFSRKEYQFLCSCDLLVRGFDEPGIEVVVLGRPTMSVAKMTQMVGRGTRPLREIVAAINAARTAAERHAAIRASAKPLVTVVDVAGISGSLHLPDTVDIVGGIYEPAVREEARHVIRSGAGRPEVNEALKEAKLRLDAAESERRRGIVMRAKFECRDVDPFDLFDVRPRRCPMALRGKKPTERMVQFLRRQDENVKGDLSFWEAKQLIDSIVKRRDAGPPTPRQAALLQKFGNDPSGMTFKQASAAIEALARDGWSAARAEVGR